MRRKFYTLDVFTETTLAGNPLAVVLDCEGLDSARMQAIAREFNLSETVFVLPPGDVANTARARIFTPGQELPFAGHPTIGTAVLLAELRAAEMLARHDVSVVLEEIVGKVQCTVRHKNGGAPRASFVLPRLPTFVEPLGPREAIAAALGLELEDIGCRAHKPARFSAGVPFSCVPLAGRRAVSGIRLDYNAWAEAFGGDGQEPVFAYCAEPVDAKHHFHARTFAPALGIGEDPATGSAVAAFAGALMKFQHPADGDHVHIIEQGFDMGRPSLITLGLEVVGGELLSATIGGSAVIAAQGILDA